MDDLELRLVEPARNRFRLYGLTVYLTLFGELCLRITWGRIGNRALRSRDEIFSNRLALEKRRDVLLARRRQHGYTVFSELQRHLEHGRPLPSPALEVARDLVEAHGLGIKDPAVRVLVAQWHAATLELAHYLEARRPENFDLVDVSTLAAMYVDATAA